MSAVLPLPTEWTLDSVPLAHVDVDLVRDNEDLFYMVIGASFVEIAADLYTQNLIDYFGNDPEVAEWLTQQWQHEEVRHGRVLRAYAQHVWPEFDWQRAYDAFYAEYSQMCTVDEFEPTQGLEMVARCVVETGTATFYTALSRQATEPVLAGIAQRIRADEVNHYKHFYRYFRKYQQAQPPGRWKIFQALKRRVLEARASDADCALWHVYQLHEGGQTPDRARFKLLCRRLGRGLQRHYPVEMAVKMVVKPLDLPTVVGRMLLAPLSKASAWLLR
ncbi:MULTISPECIES: ferritin-like domain-containing protein [unclassified Pusillimonas]|uniref:ferritin-like domain-containing protein n=1 Tax=unclassified Pusillimonas TaxID=2640016 RepID=UPI000B9D3527|nr:MULTISPECIES: ferritin-like domain-containing protein [unclassified Pusillimonas]OXR48324.1 ferritin [Pusillimonas sp. T2]ROT44539.1 ferritin [Pusillimonas sp. NJUB218]